MSRTLYEIVETAAFVVADNEDVHGDEIVAAVSGPYVEFSVRIGPDRWETDQYGPWPHGLDLDGRGLENVDAANLYDAVRKMIREWASGSGRWTPEDDGEEE